MENDTTKALNKVIRIDEAEIRGHLDEMVRGTVEETLNALLDAEADEMCKAPILLNEKCLRKEAFCLYGGVVQDEPQQPDGCWGPAGFAPHGARCKTLPRFVEPAGSFRSNPSNTKKGHPDGQPFLVFGGSCRIRTCDQLVKSQLLYQLS